MMLRLGQPGPYRKDRKLVSQSVVMCWLLFFFASFFYLVKDGLGIFWRVDVYSLAPSLFHL